MLPGTHSLVAFLQLELFWGYILYYWVLVVVVVVVPVLEPSPPPVAASATPTAELTVLTLVAEELPPKPALLPTLLLRPPVQVQPTQKSPQAQIWQKCHTELFHNNFPSLNEWRFTQKHFGRDRVYTTKACELRCGELAMGF